MDFEYLFFFVKSKRYFFDIDAARQPLSREQRAEAQRLARRYGYDGKTSYEDWYFKRRKKASWIPGPRNLVMGMQAVRGMGRNRPYLLHPFGKSRRCVWSIAPRPFSGAHFAVYPPSLVETPIKAGCPENGIVLDPFMGSGTTALAALQLGRRFIGIELNPDYVRLANQRLKPHITAAQLAA